MAPLSIMMECLSPSQYGRVLEAIQQPHKSSLVCRLQGYGMQHLGGPHMSSDVDPLTGQLLSDPSSGLSSSVGLPSHAANTGVGLRQLPVK